MIWTLWVADLHLGSAFSMWPPGVRLSTGAKPNLNDAQRYVGEGWRSVVKEVKDVTGGKLGVLGMVGDGIHGPGNNRRGEYVIENDLAFQGRAMAEVLGPLREMSDEYYQFKGTRWHVGDFSETQELVAEGLGAEPDDLGHFCWTWMPRLDVGGVPFDVTHKRSSTLVNQAMALEREQRFAKLLPDLKGGSVLWSVIVRAHAHREVLVMVDGEISVGLPPMQMQTEFAQQAISPNRYLSRWMGACLIGVEPRNVGTVRSPVDVRFLHFKHPPLAGRKYRGRSWRGKLLSRISQ